MAAASHWLLIANSTANPPLPAIPSDIREPHAAETVWRLGVGGAVVAPRVRAGWDKILTTTLYNNGVVCSYSPDPTIEAVVWRGDDAANLFFPTVEWISAPASSIRLAIRSTDTAGLEPGRYSLRVGITVQGIRLLAYDGHLDVEAAPGSNAGLTPIVTGRDLTFYYDQLPTLHNDQSDEAPFLRQRQDATEQFYRMLENRYMARPGYTRKRAPATYDHDLGYDVPDETVVPPTKADVTNWLKAGGLIVEQEAREIVARMALFLILDRQETDGQNPYRSHAQEQRDRVAALWGGYQAQIDANLDGIADWLIGTDATFLPAGAAP